MRLRPGLLLTLVALAGCGPRVSTSPPPAAPPTPTPAPATPAPTATAPAASRFAFLPGSASYDVRSESTVEMTSGPDAERGKEHATVSARVTYEIGATAHGTTPLTGQVESLSMDASSRIGGATPPPAEPVRFQGAIDARGAHVDIQGAAFGCAGPAGAAQAAGIAAARETLLQVPTAIAVATRWRDSVTVTACRGPVPTMITSIARYEITAVEGNRVKVRRELALQLHGQAIAGGRPVTVTGTGGGLATLELDAALGRLTRIDGDTRATITVTLPDGAREFAQQVRTEVRAR
jgi:hypothetical protein